MLFRLLSAATFSVSVLGTMTAHAQSAGDVSGLALFIANEDYSRLRDARGADGVLQAQSYFQTADFMVDQATDVSAAAMRAALGGLSGQLDETSAPRLVIVFSGYVVHSGDSAWILGTETSRPNLATVDQQGVRLETLLALAGSRQGSAVVAIADYGYRGRLGGGFEAGLPDSVEVPQGVSFLHGTGRQMTQALAALASPGQNIMSIAQGLPDVTLEGFSPPYLSFVPPVQISEADRAAADRAAWDEAVATGTEASYAAYIEAWPNGDFVTDARAEIDRINASPERIERALGLTRDERRAIQRDLNLLGHNTRGIDGIFGSGSRRAIAAWQAANRFEDHGYLNRDQIFLLAQQGARRAAELEEQERRRIAEQRRQDRAFWRDSGSGNSEAGMRSYLERFPEGIYASIARERIAEIDARRAAERDLRAWRQVRSANTIDGYRAYLREFPNGEYRDEARARLRSLEEENVNRRDLQAWRQARNADTIEAYRTYLQRFENGQYRDVARARIREIQDDWERGDERAWREATNVDTIPAYRAYLGAYRNGRFRDDAQARIAELQQQGLTRQERRAWRRAQQVDTIAAYNDYLAQYPNGRFSAEAHAAIEFLRGPAEPNVQPDLGEQERAAAEREEQGLGLPPFTISLIQQQLASMGFNPGSNSGQIDAGTRDAFRQYQAANNMPVTGYLSGNMVNALMAQGLIDLLR